MGLNLVHNKFNPNVQGQSHLTYDYSNDDKGNATKPKEVSGKADPVEVITDMVRQLLKDSSLAENTRCGPQENHRCYSPR